MQRESTPTSAPALLLGTASPRRHRILAALGVRFEVACPGVEEVHDDADAVRTVSANALAKHAWCQERFQNRWILTADTVVEFEGVCVGKPRDAAHAAALLRSYAGKAQHVFTAVALSVPQGSVDVRVLASSLRFRALDDLAVAEYLRLAGTLDRAGAYDIDTHGERIIQGFVGSYTNIMGLPAEAVRDWLVAHGYPLAACGRVLTPPPAWCAEVGL